MPFPSGAFRSGGSRCRPFVVCVGVDCWRDRCQSCDLGADAIKRVGPAGWFSACRHAGESAPFRRHVVCGPTSFTATTGRSQWGPTATVASTPYARGMGCVRPHRDARANRERTGRGGRAASAEQRQPMRARVAAEVVLSVLCRVHNVTTCSGWRGCVAGWTVSAAPVRC